MSSAQLTSAPSNEKTLSLIQYLEFTVLAICDAANTRNLSLSNPLFITTIHPDFRASASIPGATSLLSSDPLPLDEYLAKTRVFWDANPHAKIENLDMDMNVDEEKGEAQVFLNHQIVGGGLVRPSVGIFRFRRDRVGGGEGWRVVTLELAVGMGTG